MECQGFDELPAVGNGAAAVGKAQAGVPNLVGFIHCKIGTFGIIARRHGTAAAEEKCCSQQQTDERAFHYNSSLLYWLLPFGRKKRQEGSVTMKISGKSLAIDRKGVYTYLEL